MSWPGLASKVMSSRVGDVLFGVVAESRRVDMATAPLISAGVIANGVGGVDDVLLEVEIIEDAVEEGERTRDIGL